MEPFRNSDLAKTYASHILASLEQGDFDKAFGQIEELESWVTSVWKPDLVSVNLTSDKLGNVLAIGDAIHDELAGTLDRAKEKMMAALHMFSNLLDDGLFDGALSIARELAGQVYAINVLHKALSDLESVGHNLHNP